MLSYDQNEKLNFETASILILEQSQNSMDVMSQIFMGFGARSCHRAFTIEEATKIVRRTTVDLIVADPNLRDEDGFSFIRWLRRSDLEPNRTTPVVVVSANSSSVSIKRARDSGATFYLAKPISPKTLLDRVMWVLRDNRQFVITDTFAGPDRRFRLEGPPPGVAPRRKTDITSRLSQTAESNMSQNEIDSLLKPQKVSL
jgi:DNA-binding response OmpR family regulator